MWKVKIFIVAEFVFFIVCLTKGADDFRERISYRIGVGTIKYLICGMKYFI